MPRPSRAVPGQPDLPRLLAYVADLELEVDRLRRHGRLVYGEVKAGLDRVRGLCTGDSAAEIAGTVDELAGVMRELRDPPGFHPAHDQVTTLAVRPLVEQVFRSQQRMHGAADAALRLELEVEHVEWFPSRLRHVLDNLFSNAMKFRDPEKDSSWVRLGLRESDRGYELTVSDNGRGMPTADRERVLDLFYRAAPARAAGLGVGLAVVKFLVEQSGGALALDAGEGQGSTFRVHLPHYDLDDFLI